MTGAPVDDDHLAPGLAARSTIPSRSRPDLSAIFAGVRDLPEAIIAIVALLSMRALGVTPWIAIGLAVAIYIGVTLLRPRLQTSSQPLEPDPPAASRDEIPTNCEVPSSAEAKFVERFGLTPREREILPYLAHRMTEREIADRLFKSPKTVEHQTASILGKLGVDSRRDVATFAARHGVTFPPIPPRLDG